MTKDIKFKRIEPGKYESTNYLYEIQKFQNRGWVVLVNGFTHSVIFNTYVNARDMCILHNRYNSDLTMYQFLEWLDRKTGKKKFKIQIMILAQDCDYQIEADTAKYDFYTHGSISIPPDVLENIDLPLDSLYLTLWVGNEYIPGKLSYYRASGGRVEIVMPASFNFPNPFETM